MKKFQLVIAAALLSLTGFAQTEFQGKIYVGSDKKVVRIDKVTVEESAKQDNEVTKTWTTKDEEGRGIEVTQKYQVKKGKGLPKHSITHEVSMGELTGYAYPQGVKDKPGIIKLKFWKSIPNQIPKGRKIVETTRDWSKTNGDKSKGMTPNSTVTASTTKATWERLYKVLKDDYDGLNTKSAENWVTHSDREIAVYKEGSSSEVEYYLIDRFDQDATYHLKLDDGDKFWTYGGELELGVTALPLKYHVKHKEQVNDSTEVTVNGHAVADFNLGLTVGWSYGGEKYRYLGGKLKNTLRLRGAVLGTVAFGKQDLNRKTTSSSGDEQLEEGDTRAIPVVSLGIGTALSVHDAQIAFFIGSDLALNKGGRIWDYHGSLWVGAGIGYNISALFAKKE